MKTYFTYIVVEDVPLQRANLIQMLSNRLDLKLLKEFDTAREAYNYLSKEGTVFPDLMFLDIEMPEVNGLHLLEATKKLNLQPRVIITSAHEEYAIPSYDYDVSGYLLKPLEIEKLNKAIDKALHEVEQNAIIKEDSEASAVSFGGVEPASFLIQVGDRMFKINFKELIYCEGANNYIKIITTSQIYETRRTLKNILKDLSESQFMRVHDSFIVNFRYLKSYTKRFTSLELCHEQECYNISVGRKYRSVLKTHLHNKEIKR
ncbi:MAG: LytR/AlgR family response regulator transcription factor [Chitinophagales bacterium]